MSPCMSAAPRCAASGRPSACPPKRRRRRAQGRQRRVPEAAMGAMIQVDASPFAWLETRGPTLTLVGAMSTKPGRVHDPARRDARITADDDRTGRVHQIRPLGGFDGVVEPVAVEEEVAGGG
jgi:hypothetical protein